MHQILSGLKGKRKNEYFNNNIFIISRNFSRDNYNSDDDYSGKFNNKNFGRRRGGRMKILFKEGKVKYIKVFIEEKGTRILKIKGEEELAELKSEINGTLPYIKEFETTSGEIITSDMILSIEEEEEL